MPIYGLMVTKNEAHRYLDYALSALSAAVDDVFVYDDQSSDATVGIAREHGAHVWVRPNHVPPFLDHEGRFRQGAWNAFCATVGPTVGDWVLAVDADELVVTTGDTREVLRRAATQAGDSLARLVRIPEAFDLRDGIPYIRTDGLWGTIRGSRFFAYQSNGRFADKPMASGSEPTYIEGHIGSVVDDLWLLHLGYADFTDRVEKYERYSQRTGHADAHVASILAEPQLAVWTGPIPRCLASA